MRFVVLILIVVAIFVSQRLITAIHTHPIPDPKICETGVVTENHATPIPATTTPAQPSPATLQEPATAATDADLNVECSAKALDMDTNKNGELLRLGTSAPNEEPDALEERKKMYELVKKEGDNTIKGQWALFLIYSNIYVSNNAAFSIEADNRALACLIKLYKNDTALLENELNNMQKKYHVNSEKFKDIIKKNIIEACEGIIYRYNVSEIGKKPIKLCMKANEIVNDPAIKLAIAKMTNDLKWYIQAAESLKKNIHFGQDECSNNYWSLWNHIAKTYYERKNYKEALEWYLKTASGGEINSSNDSNVYGTLAKIYSLGEGVPQNFEQAMHWYLEAKRINHDDSLVMVPNENNERLNLLIKEADNGNIFAYSMLGDFYYGKLDNEADDVYKSSPPNYPESFKWYLKLANQLISKESKNLDITYMIVLAQEKVQEMYYEGKGVDKNYNEAFKWALKLANQPISEENDNYLFYLHLTSIQKKKVRDMYYEGKGVDKNYDEAFKLALKLADDSLYDAGALTFSYFYGLGTPINYFEAYKWFLIDHYESVPTYMSEFKKITEADITKKLTPEQIKEAQEAAEKFKNEHPDKGC